MNGLQLNTMRSWKILRWIQWDLIRFHADNSVEAKINGHCIICNTIMGCPVLLAQSPLHVKACWYWVTYCYEKAEQSSSVWWVWVWSSCFSAFMMQRNLKLICSLPLRVTLPSLPFLSLYIYLYILSLSLSYLSWLSVPFYALSFYYLHTYWNDNARGHM